MTVNIQVNLLANVLTNKSKQHRKIHDSIQLIKPKQLNTKTNPDLIVSYDTRSGNDVAPVYNLPIPGTRLAALSCKSVHKDNRTERTLTRSLRSKLFTNVVIVVNAARAYVNRQRSIFLPQVVICGKKITKIKIYTHKMFFNVFGDVSV